MFNRSSPQTIKNRQMFNLELLSQCDIDLRRAPNVQASAAFHDLCLVSFCCVFFFSSSCEIFCFFLLSFLAMIFYLSCTRTINTPFVFCLVKIGVARVVLKIINLND